MPLYKKRNLKSSNEKSKFKSPLLSNKLNADIAKTASNENSSNLPLTEECKKSKTSDYAYLKSPTEADECLKIAESPKQTASSFEIDNGGSKEAQQDKFIFKECLDKGLPKSSKKKPINKGNEKKKAFDINLFEKPKKKSTKLKKAKRENEDTSTQSSQEISLSQKILLSQEVEEFGPPEHLPKRKRLQWLQDKRDVGLYAQCDNCDKFRYLEDVADPTELPEKWYCYMNKDVLHNTCDAPEAKIPARKEEDLIFNSYNAGSVVWAKLPPFPWWPAMVDDDPDVEQYFWLKSYSAFPSHYNVTFFDSELVTRSWITIRFLKPFKGNENMFSLKSKLDKEMFSERFSVAKRQAIEALSYKNISDRLKRFSFLVRWPYEIGEQKEKVCKKKTNKRIAKTKKALAKENITVVGNDNDCQTDTPISSCELNNNRDLQNEDYYSDSVIISDLFPFDLDNSV